MGPKTKKKKVLPAQKVRTSRARREGVIVPDPLSSSSDDGRPAACTAGTAGPLATAKSGKCSGTEASQLSGGGPLSRNYAGRVTELERELANASNRVKELQEELAQEKALGKVCLEAKNEFLEELYETRDMLEDYLRESGIRIPSSCRDAADLVLLLPDPRGSEGKEKREREKKQRGIVSRGIQVIPPVPPPG